MEDALVSVASALNVYERKLDAAALNVVHARTPGYFTRVVGAKSFASEYSDAAAATHVSAVEGVAVKPGEPIASQNPLAATIVGDGFFEVRSPVGPLYTRGGDFELVDGAISTRGGFPVEGVDGPIRPNPLGGPARLDENGRVVQDGAEIGRFKIVRFAEDQKFLPAGETLVSPDGGAGPSAVEAPRLAPGTVEIPSQNAVQGLVDMVAIQRGFEGAQRAATVMHDAFERLLRSPN